MKTNLPLHIPNIHIDKVKFIAPCTHRPLGKTMYLDQDDLGFVSFSATAQDISLKDGWETIHVRSRQINDGTGSAEMIEIHCCPPLVLQRHNLFGHSDLQSYIYALLNLITRKLDINVDPFDRMEWDRGGIKITEAHLTTNFACDESLILPIIQAIDENKTQGKQRIIPTSITLNGGIKRRSTFHALTIYGKAQELRERFKNPGEVRRRLIVEAEKGIRVEVKLYSQSLKTLDLNYVMRWKDIDIADLFFNHLDKYKLPSSIQLAITDSALALLSKPEKNIYNYWLSGADLNSQFARTTVWKHTKSILKKTGIDISGNRRPVEHSNIDLNRIFSRENTLPIPDWAIGTEYYFSPDQKDFFKGSKHGIGRVAVQLPDGE
ncbi:phage/plasmid replication protein, II/X family [Undibacterium sp. TJN19]|uniref:phage/plasmid replication protein, II/X family n=1 Tax=Undibacterium sp. TJN19 TaxID=3413055 RepID=UPI003BF033FB